jgi:hypothetical protein
MHAKPPNGPGYAWLPYSPIGYLHGIPAAVLHRRLSEKQINYPKRIGLRVRHVLLEALHLDEHQVIDGDMPVPGLISEPVSVYPHIAVGRAEIIRPRV